MRVLVTGASGHVGGAIARRLCDAGHEVVGLGRRRPEIDGLSGWIEADLGSESARGVGPAPDTVPCEAIVHAAAVIALDPHELGISRVNCVGTQRMLALAERWETARFVYLSSVPVIGVPRLLPIAEDHPVDPPTAYHASKLYGEHLVGLAQRRGLSAASLRLTSPVGPRMPDGRIFSVFVRSAVAGRPLEVAGEGTRRQDYVDVRDVATAVEAALERGADGLYNVASGRAVSNQELARECVAVLGSSSEVRLGGRPDPEEGVRWEVSIDRARAELGFEPRHDLECSIRAVALDVGD